MSCSWTRRGPGTAEYLAYVAQLQGRENLLPAERAAMARAAAEDLQSGADPEPRIVHAGRAYEERLARRSEWQQRAGAEGDRVVEPDVEQRAYVVAPAAPGSGWPYRDMTRALSIAATSHLFSPVPDQGTATASAREAAVMRESMAADRRARQMREATTVAEHQEQQRRQDRQAGRSREAERDGASLGT